MQAGDRVRLKSDPTRVGVLSGQEQVRRGKRRLEVRFQDEDQFIPDSALEKVDQTPTNRFTLLEQGRFGHAKDLRVALTFYRLSGRLANLIYSMGTTNTEFYAYQFKPVLNFLDSPSRGLLIADEVGLGKTIEAGLIWTELRARFDARRLLVICPAMLREKWRDELLNRFGIQADICNARETLTILKHHRSGDRDTFALVTSLQGLRPPRGWQNTEGEEVKYSAAAKLARYLVEQELEDPFFDLVIVDEAHYLRNPESQTAKLGGMLRSATDNLVMLSATPIQLKSDDLFNLLHLLDEDSFPFKHSFSETLQANAPLIELRDGVAQGVIGRDKFIQSASKARSHPLLHSNRQLKALLENPPSSEALMDIEQRAALADAVDRINLLGRVVSRTRKREVHEWRVIRQPFAYKAEMSSVERTFYENVTARVRAYCETYDMREGFLLTIPQRQMCSSMAAACRAWKKKINALKQEDINAILYEDTGQDLVEGKAKQTIGPLIQELMSIARDVGDYDALYRNDSKFTELLKHLRSYWADYPDKKIVLFSYYRETLDYLMDRLTEENIYAIVVKGGLDKQSILNAFQQPDGPRILLSSEVASEGVDLQFSSLLINYDLPWNPMRVEQRIGRLDRIGQKEEKINIWNMFYADTLDDRVYSRLFQRLQIFEHALGALEAVLGDEIRDMTYDLLRHELSPEEEKERIDQTHKAVANKNLIENELEEQAATLVAHGDYIQNKVKAAKELNRFVSGEDLYHYFYDYFERRYPGCRFIQKSADQLLFDIELTPEARADIGQYLQRNRLQGATRLAAPDERRITQYLFENNVGKSERHVEMISQYHPVVRYISQTLRGSSDDFYPLAALEMSAGEIPDLKKGIYFYHVQRWSVQGVRDIERLVFKTVPLEEPKKPLPDDNSEKLITTAALAGKDWLAARNTVDGRMVSDLFDETLTAFESQFHSYKERLDMENNDRVDQQIQSVSRHKDRRIATLTERIQAQMLKGRNSVVVRLDEGKIRKEKERAQERIVRLEKARDLRSDYRDVSIGVIRVY